MRLYKGKRQGDVAFCVTETQFKHYKIKSQPKVGKLYDLENDLSRKWREFLKEKESISGLDLESLQKRDWEDFVDKISYYIPRAFNRKKFSVKVNATAPQKALISLQEIDGSATLCIEVGDENFEMYIKKEGKVNKLSSNYVKDEWKKFTFSTADKLFFLKEVD